MLTTLNTQQKEFKNVIKKEWLTKFLAKDIDFEALKTGVRFCYKKMKNKSPSIIIVNDPIEAVKKAHQLGVKTITTVDYFGLGYDSGWLSFYDFFYRLRVIKSELFRQYRDFISCGAFAYIFLSDAVIAVKPPLYVKRDERKRIHCKNGPAIEFENGGFKSYRWHGVLVPEQLILHPETITKEFIENEKNSEVQRAIAEKLGWNKYLELVDVKLIDKWFDETTSSHYELYDFKKRKGELQPKLLKMESAELNDGTRPFYIEPVPPESQSCKAARRWQCDPIRPSIQECNKNSDLIFKAEF